MKKNKHTKIFLVIPIWNVSDRKKLGLKEYEDLPEIDELKESEFLVKHEMKNLEFFNGITKTRSKLKDRVHVFVFRNY